MDINLILQEAKEHGFTLAVPLDPDTITLLPEVREMCAVCNAYDKKWSCPPACGTLEECGKKIKGYKKGIIVQTTAQLEDDFDAEGMMDTSKKHGESFTSFTKRIKELYGAGNVLPLGAGGCTRCKKCAYPDDSCRFPDLMTSSMESFGILISDLCKKNNVPYNHGRGTLTYVGCFLFDKNGEVSL